MQASQGRSSNSPGDWVYATRKDVDQFQGRPADPKRAFRNLTDDVLGEAAKGIVRHTMRHTAATWLMQGGVDMWQAAGYLGMTKETLEKTYGHHHPDHQGDVGDAFTTGRAGRMRQ
jgi:integrase